MSRPAMLPNPDTIWPHERTFADICSDMAGEARSLKDQFEFLEEQVKEWSNRLDQIGGDHG